MWRLAKAHALTALVIAAASPVAANARIDVDLELVLAVDVSQSMDYQEQQLQREGYVAAFRDPEVRRAIGLGPRGRIAVTYVEWSGSETQQVVLPWTLIDSQAAAEAFAQTLATQPISRGHTTSISGALAFSGQLLQESPFHSTRRVIDISGDGINNSGAPVAIVRDRLVGEGIVINGLPILDGNSSASSEADIPGLDLYYSNCVIGGAGAFVVPIRARSDFTAATRQKLLLEISDVLSQPRIVRAQHVLPDRTFNCQTGTWHRPRNDSRWHRLCVAMGLCEPR
jgi:hypothetical protein